MNRPKNSYFAAGLPKIMDKLKGLVRGHYAYLAAFLITPIILLSAYMLRGVYPFGQGSVLVLDLNAQYIYYYEYYRNLFLADSSLLYSFGRSLGGEMIGTFAYYLASPFSLILLLFPKALITEAVLAMILIKVGAAALTFAVYLRVARKAQTLTVILFSTMYGLISYNVIQTMNPMWLDGPIFFPLIILAVERLVDYKHYAFYVITLALMIMANFYIGYMVGIFVFIYFIYYHYVREGGESRGCDLKVIGIFLSASLVAVAGSLWLLLPTYQALRFGKFGFTNPNFAPLQKLDIFDLYAKMLPLSYDSVNVQGHPFIYCGLLTLILLALYFTSAGIARHKKIAAAMLLTTIVVFFSVSSLDLLLHGFQDPIWLNFRYAFIFSFFALILAFEAFEVLKKSDQIILFRTCLALLLITALVGRLAGDWIRPEKTIWLSYLLLTLYSFLLYYLKVQQVLPSGGPDVEQPSIKTVRMKWLQAILLFIVFLELFLNTIALIDSAHKEVYYSDRNSYRDYFDRLYPAIDLLKQNDQEFYRTETVMRRTVNDPLALGIYGVSHSSSVFNQSVIDLMFRLGFAAREHWTSYKGATPVTDSLFGVCYILAEKPVNNLYHKISEQNEVLIYKNQFAMPFVYAVDEKLTAIELDSHDPFANQNFLLSTMIGEPYTEYFKLSTIREVIFENIEGMEQEDLVAYSIVNPNQNAHIEYLVETAANNEMYMYLVSSIPRKVNIWKNKEYVDTFFDYSSVCIIPLGANPDDETISLITTPIEGEYYLNHNLFYYLDRPVFEAAMAKLNPNKAQVERISDTKLRIEAEVEEGEILFTSIPYDQGWQVKIDGEKAEITKILGSLLAVKVSPGKRLITFEYCPRGFKAGMIMSSITWLLFAAGLASERFSGRKLFS
jgi:uncharacterized membrane protein YfhO